MAKVSLKGKGLSVFFVVFSLLVLVGAAYYLSLNRTVLYKSGATSQNIACFTSGNDCVLPGGHDRFGAAIPCQSCGCGKISGCNCVAFGADAQGKMIYGNCYLQYSSPVSTPKPSVKPTVKPSVKPTVKPTIKPTPTVAPKSGCAAGYYCLGTTVKDTPNGCGVNASGYCYQVYIHHIGYCSAPQCIIDHEQPMLGEEYTCTNAGSRPPCKSIDSGLHAWNGNCCAKK